MHHLLFQKLEDKSSYKTFTAGYESEKYYKLDEETGIYIRDDSLVPDPLDNRPYYDLNNTSYITTP